jgi:uncharacterized membrane protein
MICRLLLPSQLCWALLWVMILSVTMDKLLLNRRSIMVMAFSPNKATVSNLALHTSNCAKSSLLSTPFAKTTYSGTSPPLFMRIPDTHGEDSMEMTKSKYRSTFRPSTNDSMKSNHRVNRSSDKSPSSTSVTSTTTAIFSLMVGMTLVLGMMPDDAYAAMSGGRIGGSSFRSGGGGRSMSMPSSSRMVPSYRGGGGPTYYRSSPSVIVAPPPIFVNPFTPFGGFGYGYGAGALSIYRGPSFFDILFWGGVALAISNAILNSVNRNTSELIPSMQSLWSDDDVSVLGPGISTIRLSVAMDVPNRSDRSSILNMLDRLASTANTEEQRGLQSLTKTVALEILRRKSSIRYASGRAQHFSNREKAMREYNKMAIQERSKFERETMSRFNGITSNTRSSIGSGVGGTANDATMAVVTLVLAIDGDSTKIPALNSITDVQDALERIATDATVSDCLQGAEILWTPDDPSETLTTRDIVADYPDLRAL